MKKNIPGIIVTVIVATISYIISHLSFSPFTIIKNGITIHPIEPMIIAIVLGIILGNTLLKSKSKTSNTENLNGIISSKYINNLLKDGIKFSAKIFLPFGIILLGVRFNLYDLLKISGSALLINLSCIAVAYYLTIFICNKLKIDPQMSALITIGTAICGSSAIVATSPVIKANETQTSIAMAVVSLYGLIAIFTFPIIYNFLGLTEMQYGIFSGAVIQAVPQVVAAGFAVSVFSGQIATIVKMVRIMLLAPMVILIGMKYNKNIKSNKELEKKPWHHYCPKFIIFFILIVILNTFGLFNYLNSLTGFNFNTNLLHVSFFFMTTAMVGIGINTDLITLIKQGGKPLLAGGIAMFILGVFSLVIIILFSY